MMGKINSNFLECKKSPKKIYYFLSVIPCWIYLLKQFPEQLLNKPHLEEYKNSNENPYIERSKRESNIQAKDFV